MHAIRNFSILALIIWAVLASPWSANGFPMDAHALLSRSEVVAAPAEQQLEVGFSPGGSAEVVVLHIIDSASKTLRVAAYEFTSRHVADALLRAKARGVDVAVVMDQSQLSEPYSALRSLAAGGIPIRIDSAHHIQHNKYVVSDGDSVETGSFNFTTTAASKNGENALTIWHNPKLAAVYARDWQYHWEHSDAYPSGGRS